MKIPALLLVCILVCSLVPLAAGDRITTSVSTGAGTVEYPPENVSVYISDARAAVAGQNWTSALLLTTRGVAYYPDNAELHCLQGYSYRKIGQYGKSIDAVTKGILLDPKAVRYANRGYGYLAQKIFSAALADAETGIALDRNYSTNYGVKALALRGLGRNNDALAAIDMALTLDPENAHYWHVKGIILAAGGNCPAAGEALARSAALDSGYSLPYPGFAGAEENLAALNATCTPAPAPASPSPRNPLPAGLPLSDSSGHCSSSG